MPIDVGFEAVEAREEASRALAHGADTTTKAATTKAVSTGRHRNRGGLLSQALSTSLGCSPLLSSRALSSPNVQHADLLASSSPGPKSRLLARAREDDTALLQDTDAEEQDSDQDETVEEHQGAAGEHDMDAMADCDDGSQQHQCAGGAAAAGATRAGRMRVRAPRSTLAAHLALLHQRGAVLASGGASSASLAAAATIQAQAPATTSATGAGVNTTAASSVGAAAAPPRPSVFSPRFFSPIPATYLPMMARTASGLGSTMSARTPDSYDSSPTPVGSERSSLTSAVQASESGRPSLGCIEELLPSVLTPARGALTRGAASGRAPLSDDESPDDHDDHDGDDDDDDDEAASSTAAALSVELDCDVDADASGVFSLAEEGFSVSADDSTASPTGSTSSGGAVAAPCSGSSESGDSGESDSDVEVVLLVGGDAAVPPASAAAAGTAPLGGSVSAAAAAAAPRAPSPLRRRARAEMEEVEAASSEAAAQLLRAGGTRARVTIASAAPALRVPATPEPTVPAAAPTTAPALASTGAAAAAAAAPTALSTPRLLAAAANIPHVDKADKGGEDAWAVLAAREGLPCGALVVADGVSGWADEGIDAAAYSRTLVAFAADALRAAAAVGGGAPGGGIDPREVIRHAHHETMMPGSSTVCVCAMKPEGTLHVANLGDSGVRLIRDGAVVYASTAQQHSFNMPYQLSHPLIMESPDDADAAEVVLLDMRPGDVVVLATDGLYDNIFDDEIVQIVGRVARERLSGGAHAAAGAGGARGGGPAASGAAAAAPLAHGGLGQLGTSAGSTAGRLRLRLQRPGAFSAPNHHNHHHHHHHSSHHHHHHQKSSHHHAQYSGSSGQAAHHAQHHHQGEALSSVICGAAERGALSDKDARAIASTLARTAHAYACNPCRRTPWSVAASGTGAAWSRQFASGGGKMDDVTVVVAFVVSGDGGGGGADGGGDAGGQLAVAPPPPTPPLAATHA